jgi:hypothetical protein
VTYAVFGEARATAKRPDEDEEMWDEDEEEVEAVPQTQMILVGQDGLEGTTHVIHSMFLS